MSVDPFKSASFGDSITAHEDRLLLITPTEYQTGIVTKFSNKEKPTSDAVTADFVVLDAEEGPEQYTGAMVFQGPLIKSLKTEAKFNEQHGLDPLTGFPKMVLGRLERGEDKRKLGEDKRPWILSAPTDEDKDLARKYLATLKADDPFAS